MFTIILTLILTHITIICVTLYLHRSQAHRAVEFHPAVSHFMRFWLWLTTGMVTKQWVAIHRKHHRFTDEEDDPHSPVHTAYGMCYSKEQHYIMKHQKIKTWLIHMVVALLMIGWSATYTVLTPDLALAFSFCSTSPSLVGWAP